MTETNTPHDSSRRNFIKTAGMAAIGAAAVSSAPFQMAFGHSFNNSSVLKVGLVGCGGRGTGAASQALKADKNTVLVAMADVFEDHLNSSYDNLLKIHGEQVKVDKSHRYVGLDAYHKLIHSDVDVVILAAPPAFRPDHFEEAVKMRKHIFTEKPMAVDADGVRRTIAAAREAKAHNLAVVSGFCWRYDLPKRETFGKILAGEVGQVMSIYNTYNTGPAWTKERKPGWSDMEFQMRNWPHFNWISGDSIAEQAVHSIDMMSWAMGDTPPLRAVGTGGRQINTGSELGNIYDHFAIVYEYANGAKGYHFSRKQTGCSSSYAVEIAGTQGNCMVDCMRSVHRITTHDGKKWDYRGPQNDMYQTEHDELFASIRSGKVINDGEWMAQSTMLALMGRMVAYTGQTITWEDAMNSKEKLGPEKYEWNVAHQGSPIAQPGITKFF